METINIQSDQFATVAETYRTLKTHSLSKIQELKKTGKPDNKKNGMFRT